MAGLSFIESDFAWMTQQLLALAGEVCDNRVVSVLEGGYDLPSLASSVQAHVRTLMTA
jgi:acetoin utilization deacetylase AcuC-like enzyme